MSDQIANNKRRCTTAMAQMAVPVAIVVALVAGLAAQNVLVFVVVALVVGGLMAVVLRSVFAGAADVALRLTGARPADPTSHARLLNLVDGLCTSAGLPMPAVHVVADTAPNAFSVGRDPRSASLVVTEGLLASLTRIELEGVLAHELSHIKSHDILPSTLAVGLLRLPIGPLVRPLVERLVPPEREAIADVTGVGITRYPPGLIAALEKVRDSGATPASASAAPTASPATAHLWLAEPEGRALAPRPPLEERIEALREL